MLENGKWQKNIGILITSHRGNRAYLRGCLETHKKLGYWITVMYDNPYESSFHHLNHNDLLPPIDLIGMMDTFVIPHHQTWGGVLYPYFWLLNLGGELLQNFEYIYCINGDMIIEKPEGFPKLLELLGDGDFLGVGPDRKVVKRCFNTAGFISKTEAFRAIMKHFKERLIPLEAYEKYTQESGNTEARFDRAIIDLGLNQVTVPVFPPDEQIRVKGIGTWYDLVGFRHIHAEHTQAYRTRGIPPELKYLDKRFMGGEYNIIEKYWETKDEEILKGWWAK